MLSDIQKAQLQHSLDASTQKGVTSLTTKDPRNAMQFLTKKEAASFALLVGWHANDALKQEIMGFVIWVISDPHLNLLTARGALRCLCQKGINPS